MNKINGMYYLGKGEVRSSILRCSTRKTPTNSAFQPTSARHQSAERGKNRQVANVENPGKDVRKVFS